jgi:hypothetical protein
MELYKTRHFDPPYHLVTHKEAIVSKTILKLKLKIKKRVLKIRVVVVKNP